MADDPKAKLTKWLTEGIPAQNEIQNLDRTRLMFNGQAEFYHGMLALDDPYFTKRVEIDMLLMASFKGKRSDDVVAALTHLDEQDAIEAGLQPIKEYMKAQSKRGRREQ